MGGGEEMLVPILDVDNLQAEKGFKALMMYGHSKSVAKAMSMALAEKLHPNDILVNIVFPERASTTMMESLSLQSLPGPMKLLYPIFWLMF
jgi:NAD(P)-dependent dehydrogenase (short-subunit alcohol dehydrogenase family)